MPDATAMTTADVDRRRLAGLALLLVLATIVAYFPAVVAGGFVWDDDDYVINREPLFQSLQGLREIWIPGTTHQYYPLVFTTFWIEYQIGGLSPHLHHLTNVLLHVANALLVWRLLAVLGLRGAWLAAALFALHPVHVESVAWITERKNVLSALFYLLAALAYLRFDRTCFDERAGRARSDPARSAPREHGATPPPGRAWAFYAAALALFAAALFSKTVTCSLPAALVLALWLTRRRLSLGRLAPLAPMLALGLWLALHTAHLERVNVGAVGSDFDFGASERLLIACTALLFYPWKLLAPVTLAFVYPKWTIDPASILAWWPVPVVAGAALLLLHLARRGVRGPPVALAFYAGTIFPALGFFNIYPMRYTFVADHYQYLASVGLLALAAEAAVRTTAPAALRRGVAAVVLATLGLLSFRQSTSYRDAETLWRRTIAVNDDCWMCHNNLGGILMRQALDDPPAGPPGILLREAIGHFEGALRVNPGHYQSRGNLALALDALGRHAEAVPHWEAVAGNERAVAEDVFRLGFSRQRAGDPDGALAAYRRALQMNPEHLGARLRLGEALLQRGLVEEALEHLGVVAERDPGNAAVQTAIGRALEDRARCPDAAAHYRRWAQRAPAEGDRVVASFRLARVLALCDQIQARNPAEALRLAAELERLTRGADALVLDTMAAALAGLGRFEEAVAAAQRALDLARAQPALAGLATEIEARLQRYRDGQPP
jgi:tetratricopeptide (TPR) repeat protein